MDSEVAALKAHIDAIVPTLATKADIEVLRAEMHKMSAEGYRWMVASMIGMFIGFGGLYFAASRSFETRPAAQPAPQRQAPIVMYLPQPQPQPQPTPK
ncbi:hypothetical protein [Duganella sp. CF517]|uniref:hypothetical protein n=1 Tax=Duganella sp. CF517 TaxID=1881038 RepID=UPI000B7C88F4|nr:hypothetical protein [Duganella sp. CF517]